MHGLSRALVLTILVLAACGDDGAPASPDAPPARDAAVVDGAVAIDCDYTEMRDDTNDDVAPATGTPEATNLTLATRAVVCGKFEHTHFDGDITVDVDSYTFAIANPTDVLVRVHGAGAEQIALVGVDIYGGAQLNQLAGAATFYGSHGATSVRLSPGTYALTVFALSEAAIPATVPYRVEVSTDMPATRCPELTTGGYAEANDGAANTDNDVIRIPSGAPPSLTPSTVDAPEPSGISLAAGTNERLTGTAADIATPDQYEDKDTFAFATGSTTNELAVRLTWPGTTTNLDYLLFEADSAEPIVRAIATATTGPELRTFSVKPSTSYWLLVGAKAGTTVPSTYSATLCPTAFTP